MRHIFGKKTVLDHFGNMGDPVMGYQRISTILVLLLTVNPAFTGYSWNHPSVEGRNYKDNLPKAPPQFDESTSAEVLVTLGQTAYLPCVVHNLGDRLVSWIRTKDLHILTNGKYTFTADQRFDVIFDPETESWTLRIQKSRITDIGKYECQVNTDPKMNRFFSLSVRETPLRDSPVSIPSGSLRASIDGPDEQYVKTGSTVTFQCQLFFEDQKIWNKQNPRFTTRSVPNVQWLKDGLAISFQAERGGISVETERGERTGSSRLTVASVGSEDAGRYTCMGQGIAPDTVTLHVVEGEPTEAMQRDEAITASRGHTLSAGLYSLRTLHWIFPTLFVHTLSAVLILLININAFTVYNVR